MEANVVPESGRLPSPDEFDTVVPPRERRRQFVISPARFAGVRAAAPAGGSPLQRSRTASLSVACSPGVTKLHLDEVRRDVLSQS